VVTNLNRKRFSLGFETLTDSNFIAFNNLEYITTCIVAD
jgi:hypothetical protein